ncbi:hypothetical protein BOTBODRAFT_584767 [Botryobasidium botryosum FD-172 SS1]|uniref:Uncharacterized protein n=1 Tax=Botryobasidium botryosum (strain FD-172 SS1) TaxID=930990 RepID=A0A067M947_BOTB1|nr:hypothetical protein BOTBODRAFT_584767 [Botryobasidium botryosum FD-172 SS1]
MLSSCPCHSHLVSQICWSFGACCATDARRRSGPTLANSIFTITSSPLSIVRRKIRSRAPLQGRTSNDAKFCVLRCQSPVPESIARSNSDQRECIVRRINAQLTNIFSIQPAPFGARKKTSFEESQSCKIWGTWQTATGDAKKVAELEARREDVSMLSMSCTGESRPRYHI